MGLDRYITELLDILKREIRSFNAVIELLILEEKCLVMCDTAGLSEVVGKQSDVLSSIACLEKSRMDILERIAAETGRDAAQLTVTEVSRLSGNAYRKEFTETAEILGHIHEDMKRKKVSNTLLVRQGIMMVENDIRMILNACGRGDRKKGGYTSAAGRQGNSGSVYLDGKA
jgi:hypothetical protein